MRKTTHTFKSLILMAMAVSFLHCSVQHQEQEFAPKLPRIEIDRASACVDWRWIAIKHDDLSHCPALETMADGLEGWRGGFLWGSGEEIGLATPFFEEVISSNSSTSSRENQRRAANLCDPHDPFMPLTCFCQYETAGEGVNLLELIGDLSAHGLAAMARDCMAVVPAAEAASLDRDAALQSRFLAQAGGFARISPSAAATGGVRLTVVDTEPTDLIDRQTGPPNSPHGYQLIEMARRLLGPAAGSAGINLGSRLTLRFLTLDTAQAAANRRDTNGGFFGLIGDLATDLTAELTAASIDPDRRLILNLSLGWNGDFNTRAPTAVAAVRSVLGAAVCNNALPLAAAGNQDWGPNPSSGPLFPAAWETLAAPTAEECARLLGSPPMPSYPRGDYRPLIHAVGAVAASGQRLPLARLAAEPRVVAFANHASVQTRFPSGRLTGSSVSTLVAATTAAAIWSTNRDLSAFEVMDRIYQSSQLLTPGRRAAFQLDSGEEPLAVKRVFACQVAKASSSAIECPQGSVEADAAFPDSNAGLLPRFETTADAQVGADGGQVLDLADFVLQAGPFDACPPTTILDLERPEADREQVFYLRPASNGPRRFPCPQWQAPAQWANGWVNPQPGSNQCSACGIEDCSPTGTGYLLIDEFALTRRRLNLPRPVLSDPILKVGNRVYLLDGLQLDGPRPIRVRLKNIPLGDGRPPAAFFSVLLDGQLSSTSLLLGPEGLEPH